MQEIAMPASRSYAVRNGIVFVVTAIVWFILDRLTKTWANAGEVGEVFVPDIAGLFEFRLVHNTGAAWGILGGKTFELALLSLLVCLAIIWFLFGWQRLQANLAEIFALALIFAGGLGNVVDRFYLGYVVDFINTTFIDFPTFNVADIGVTCGAILFVICMFVQLIKDGK